MKLIKDDKKGRVYQAEKCKIFYRHKGSVSGDNKKNSEELIYLISGSASVALQDKTWKVDAPAKVEFPAKTYHRIEALTEIIFILFE